MKTEKHSDKNDIMGSFPYIKFAEDNEYRFCKDFGFWRNAPSDVMFYPVEESNNGLMTFIGDGYGIQTKHNKMGISGKYGSGSISVYTEDIPHLLDWCRANFVCEE